MKLLTVITVTYNAEKCIERTMRSVIGQSVFDEQIEYIVVDGASKDGTMQIINQYREQLAQVISEPDHGIYDAMNKGIRMATAPWIWFMNADDSFFDAHTVENLHLKERSADRILYGDWVSRLAENKLVYQKPVPFWQNPDKCSGIGLCHQATVAPTIWMKAMLFDHNKYRYCCDFDFLYQCRKQGRNFEYVEQTLCIYEWGTGFSSNPRVSQRIFEENVRIAECKYGYWYWRHRWRRLKKALFNC